MKTDDLDKNAIPGFVTHMKNRQKLSRSGGIILSVLAKQVKIMKIDCKKCLQSSFKDYYYIMWNRLSAWINIKVVLYVRTVAKSATFNPVNISSVYMFAFFPRF